MPTSSTTFQPVSSDDSIVEIDWYEDGDLIKVNPRSQQRFEIHKIRAIKLLEDAVGAASQLDFLLQKLGQWNAQNREKLSRAYLTVRDDRFAFLAISRISSSDDDLEDSISDLDFELANDPDLNLIKLNTLVLPPTSDEAIDVFLDNRFKLVYRVQHD